jgi:hypothetical protein
MAMRTLSALAFLAAVSWAGDDGGRFESVVKSMLGAMGKMTQVLTTITDEDTAKSARPELKKVAQEWSALRKRAEDTPPPTKQEKDRLAQAYKSKVEDAQKKLFNEIGRVQLIPGGKDALTELAKSLTPAKKPAN